ncbi:MAG: hypothetical protein JNL25_05790, partial [Rhodospirillaceae bacterium]|nr:hypothetical protein [Rhodospirillaceae bacterium]
MKADHLLGNSSGLPFPSRELAPGDRFPNFLLPDQTGTVRSFLERAIGHRLLLLIDPDDDTIRAVAGMPLAAAGIDLLAIVPGSPSDAKGRALRCGVDFPLLADGNGKILTALQGLANASAPAKLAFLLDANQRVLSVEYDGDLETWLRQWQGSPPAMATAPCLNQVAPVLIVPNVLSPEMCRGLIGRWETIGHEEGGVHSIVEGVEVTRTYHAMKRRRDHKIKDAAILKPLIQLVGRRLAPELDKAFAFNGFKFDRFIVTCYEAERGDYFRRHRDNLSPSTADRRFALTINLNTPEYEGGELVFPEYGPERYSPPAGGAIL